MKRKKKTFKNLFKKKTKFSKNLSFRQTETLKISLKNRQEIEA